VTEPLVRLKNCGQRNYIAEVLVVGEACVK